MSDKYLPKIRSVDLTAAGTKEFASQPEALGLVHGRIAEKIAVSASASGTLDQTIDTNSKIEAIILRANTAVSIATGTHIGIGDGTDVDRFAEIAVSGNLNSAGAIVVLFDTELDDAEYKQGGSIVLTATNGSGSLSGTFTAADLDVIVIYKRFTGFAS